MGSLSSQHHISHHILTLREPRSSSLTSLLSLLLPLLSSSLSIPTDTRVLSKKKRLLQSKVNLATLPSSYRTQTPRELALLDYTEHFRRQFLLLYPHHPPLNLCPLNECSLRKFLPTSIKPLLLPYPDLYDLPTCASFVSDFLSYLPLDDPNTLPDLLPSLTSIVTCRAGDCLDISTLLCSLLRGAGYNAAVVQGRAESWVCQADQSLIRCPLLRDEAAERKRKEEEEARRVAEEKAKNPYLALIPQRAVHVSQFQQGKAREEPEGEGEEAGQSRGEGREGAHAWVLVMPGRRDVTVPVFVEGSTGVQWDVRGPHPYKAVEVVWNDSNAWVSVQQGGVQNMGWDFNDRTQWLEVMVGSQRGGKTKGVKGRDEEEERVEEAKEAIPPSSKQTLHLPASWVGPVSITRDQWQGRYPLGHKSVGYFHSTVDRWSPYLPGHKGLVLRVEERGEDEVVMRVEERFEHRKDRLVSRVTFLIEGVVTCTYDPGLPSGLREYRRGGGRREFHFYRGSRVDGLTHRTEVIECKVIERYEDRDDRLIYRSLTVDRTGQAGGQRQKAFAITVGGKQDLPIRKLTEKYRRDLIVECEKDVVKRVHLLLDGLIVLRYACAEGRLEGSEWVIDKNDKLESSEGGGGGQGGGGGGSRGRLDRKTKGWKEMSRGEEQVMMGRLLIVEKELKVKLKEREVRMGEMVKGLEGGEGEGGGELGEDVYVAAYQAAVNAQQVEGAREEDEEGEVSSSPTSDYLTPFLLSFPPNVPLTRKQAEAVKAACLTALKERLLSRAAIIQAHLEDEQAKLQSRQSQFKRQAGSGSMEANEEFQAFSEGCLFRIDILLARRARHEQVALKKYAEMEGMLNKDERLAGWHQGD